MQRKPKKVGYRDEEWKNSSSWNCTFQMVSCSTRSSTFIVFVTCGSSIMSTNCCTKLLITILASYFTSSSPTIFLKLQFGNVLKSISHIQDLETLNPYEFWTFKYSQRWKFHSMHIIVMTRMTATKAHNNKTNHEMTIRIINNLTHFLYMLLELWTTHDMDGENK